MSSKNSILYSQLLWDNWSRLLRPHTQASTNTQTLFIQILLAEGLADLSSLKISNSVSSCQLDTRFS